MIVPKEIAKINFMKQGDSKKKPSVSSDALLIPSNELLSTCWEAMDANQWEMND